MKLLYFLKIHKIFAFELESYKITIIILGIKISLKIKPNIINKEFEKFKNTKIRYNSVLIVEPNNFHGETLPGYVRYFKMLNFNIDLLLNKENYFNSPFLKEDKKDLRIYLSTPIKMKEILKLNKIKQYQLTMLSSADFYDNSVDSFISFAEYNQFKFDLGVIHSLNKYNPPYPFKAVSLSDNPNTITINPCYFKKQNFHNKSKITRFITVGSIEKKRKNFDLLIDSVKKLAKDNVKFKIIIIGKVGKINIPHNLKKYIKFLGNLRFSDMYYEIEKSDFFLPLLDINIEEHRRYLSSATTGSKQLILGFLKPPLINNVFANAYGFNLNNSILYKNNDLYDAMKKAIFINSDQYQKMLIELKKYYEKIFNQSLNNLKDFIFKDEIIKEI